MRQEVSDRLKNGLPLTPEMELWVADIKDLIQFERGVNQAVIIKIICKLLYVCSKIFKPREDTSGKGLQKRDK